MDWTLLFLASALFLAFYDIAKKASVNGNAVLPTLLCSTAFGSAAFVAGVLLFSDISEVVSYDPKILGISAIKALIVSTSWIFTFCALRSLPISIATPIRASAPALVFVLAFFLYGERPSLVQFGGMLLVFGGYFAFSWAGSHEGIDFFRSRAVWYAFAGALLSALSSIWDKCVFQVFSAPVESVQFWFQIFLFAVYAIVLLAMKAFKANSHPFEWRWTMPFVGILLAAADWLYFKGLSYPDVPVSVASLLRRVSVVVTFVFGARFFREKNIWRKALALAVILSGVAILCLAKK